MTNNSDRLKILGKKIKNKDRVITMKKAFNIILISWLMMFGINALAADLQSLGYSSLPGEKAQLVLTFSEPIGKPNSFSIDEPARVVLDFAGVANKLDRKTQQINVGATRSVSTVESGDRTRMVINLVQKVPYTVERDGNVIIVTIDGGNQQVAATRSANYQVEDINFRRGETGEARLTIELNSIGASVDVRQERDTIVVDLMGVSLPEKLHRRLDVVDFATPVHLIDSVQKGQNTRLTLSTKGKFEHLAYQSGKKLVIEVRPVIEETTASGEEKFGYSGEKLSLNFQQIEVRAVLQLLADFTGMNLVTSDTVQGNLTLRLKNVPWDQALDIILKTKGLAMRQNGNVMLIAPASEIAAREKQELASKNQLIQLEPLYSEIIEVNFAKASELATLLQSGPEQSSGGAGVAGFLSSRGSVTVDQRTNSLLLRDTADQLVQIRKLIDKLDVAIRQVLIESRIVIATNDFTKELGVKFGATVANGRGGTSGNKAFNQQLVSGTLNATSQLNNGEDLEQSDRLNVDLGLVNPAGTFALALAKLPFGTLLELELQALQAEGKGEVISSPRVITSNQSTAIIEQGTEIPFQEASSSGATSVSFKKAVLKLEVTPQITPDDKIIMDLKVNKDQAVFDPRFTVPSIDTKKVETQVLVDNGETVVLGGVYEQTKSQGSSRVPFFGDLPYVGFLFKTTQTIDNKQELLIFVTPKIIKDSLQF